MASPCQAGLPPFPLTSGLFSYRLHRRCPASLFWAAGHPVRKRSPLRRSLKHPKHPYKGPRKEPLDASKAGRIIYDSLRPSRPELDWLVPAHLPASLRGAERPRNLPHTHGTSPVQHVLLFGPSVRPRGPSRGRPSMTHVAPHPQETRV